MDKPMTDEEIRRELDVCEKATEPPIVRKGCHVGRKASWAPGGVSDFGAFSIEADAVFYQHARTGYPAALREVLRLRARLAEVQWNGDDSQCVFGCGHDRHDMHHHASCDYNTFGTEEVE